ncbi:MAG: YkvA family protein [Pleurocapsa sp.]
MSFSISSLYDWYRQTIRHPKYGWWLAIGTLIYLISPIDIAPDFIPIIGQIDDLVLASLLVTEVSQILLEKYKSRQQPGGVTSETTSDSTASKTTIDVEAVETETTFTK